jgi:hypothetical protein
LGGESGKILSACGFLKRLGREALGVAAVVALVLSLGTELAWMLGAPRLSLVLARHAPELFFDDEQIDRRVRLSKVLANSPNTVSRQTGAFRLEFPASTGIPAELNGLDAAADFLVDAIGGRPWFFLPIHGVPMDGVEGSIEHGRLIVHPAGKNLLRAVTHELTHWVLFWNLFPGLPLDCCRWFNEGMAESLSYEFTGEGNWAELVFPEQIVSFDRLSPAYAAPGYGTDIQGRFGFQEYRQRFGWVGIRRIIHGLRSARPFRSVVQLLLDEDPDALHAAMQNNFRKRDSVCERTPAELETYLKQAFALRREYDSQITRIFREILGRREGASVDMPLFLAFLDRHLEELCRQGNAIEAMGFLKTQRDLLSQAGWKMRQGLVRNAPLVVASASASESVVLASCSASAADLMPFPRGRSRSVLVYVAVMLCSWFLLCAYRIMRRRVTELLVDGAGQLRAGMLLLPISAWGIAWILRLLIIGIIPYTGYWGASDFERILAAEALVIAFWAAFAEKLSRGRTIPEGGTGTMGLSPMLMIPILLIPFAWEFAQNGWRASPASPAETGLIFFSNAGTVLASGLLLRRMMQSWSGGGGLWPRFWSGLVYAAFRGGLCFHITGTPLLLMQGWFLAAPRRIFSPGPLWSAVDLVYMIGHVVLVPTWFVALDPVGGLFRRRLDSPWIWLIPIMIMACLLLRERKVPRDLG